VPTDLIGRPAGVRLTAVTRVHRLGDTAVNALRGVSLSIAPGEFVALVGPSGSGKSTLLSLIGGLDRPTSGEVHVGGLALHELRDRELADFRLQRVGTVFQTFNLIQTITARDNVALPMALAGVARKDRWARAERLLNLVGLGDRSNHRPSRLSGGEQQRVSVARALANSPGLLLADEPTGNLDSEAGQKVMDLIRDLHQEGATVVMVTHDRELAQSAQRIITLKDGAVVSDGGGGTAEETAQAVAKPGRLRILESIGMGVSSVRRRKLRTGLSSGGVAVGIIAMALIVSLATGLQSSLLNAFAQAGQLNAVQVAPLGVSDLQSHKTLDQAALDGLAKLPHVTTAYGSISIQGGADANGAPLAGVQLFSESPLSQLPSFAAKFLAAGRYQSSDTAQEAVVSDAFVKKIGLNARTALGTEVIFRGIFSGFPQPGSGVPPATNLIPLTLKIVGVSTAGPAGGGGFLGITAPYQTVTKYWSAMAKANDWKADEFGSLSLISDSPANADRVRDEVKKLGYPAQSAGDFIKQFSQVLLFLELALSAFGAIALFVACLGIANTMYTAVLERTREIGILKALGARSGDVRSMFMAEAGMIGALGGLIGILVTVGVSAIGNVVVNNIAQQQGFGLDLQVFQVTWWLVAGAILLATAFSAASGLLPAIRASRLNPVLALRYE
jgi:ABC-type lipoprotein export system ATPase subunit/ABC-type antimicrobial peptide transport system permease subunit